MEENTMKFQQIENLHSTLSEFTEKEMPLRLAYKFSKILSSIEKDYEFYISEMRKIISKYSEKDDQGNPIQEEGNIKIQKDYLSMADKSIQELYNMEFNLPDIKFSLSELEDLSIKPSSLQVLLPFIEE
jgi:hypothetical protein